MSNKPCLLLIFPGPKYDLEREFGYRAEMLSKKFRGLILTANSTEQQLSIGNFIVDAMYYPEVGRRFWALRFFINGFRRALKHKSSFQGFDLIVTYDPLKSGLLGLILAKCLGTKFAPEVNGDHSDWANYADIKNLWLRKLKRSIYMLIERYVLQKADGIKLLYDHQLSPLNLDIQKKAIQRFPDYVDLRSFKNLGEEKIVLLVGFPFHVKGVDILISAFKIASATFPDWKLKILGWYPDKTELDACIGGHPNIFHHPPVYHRDMPEHIGRCAIFVLASRTEAMGRVLLEAMAAGKPRIGSNIGGIPTVINHGEDGYLFESESVSQLSAFLSQLMNDVMLRKELGKSAARRAQLEFSPEQYFKRIESFYEEILGLK